MPLLRPLVLILLGACATTTVDLKDGDADTDTDSDRETDVVATDSPPVDTTVPVDTTAPIDTSPPTPVVRFVALGDAGEGNDDQYAVAEAVRTVCAARGCDFALYLGDNFYDDGVYSVTDQQFQDKFELPYANVDLTFYPVLGNHDFGEIPVQFWRTDFQIEYSQHSTKWNMPDHFYSFTREHAFFMGLDTNMIMLGLDATGAQIPWVRRELVQHASATWKVAYGHHPWKSNGPHGNAGNYEGAWYDVTGIIRGQLIQDFFVDDLCRKVDFYLSGHDHSRQWIPAGPACGVELIVSGAGAKLTDFERRDGNQVLFEDDASEGFVWIQFEGDVATVAFYDKDATLQHEGVVSK